MPLRSSATILATSSHARDSISSTSWWRCTPTRRAAPTAAARTSDSHEASRASRSPPPARTARNRSVLLTLTCATPAGRG